SLAPADLTQLGEALSYVVGAPRCQLTHCRRQLGFGRVPLALPDKNRGVVGAADREQSVEAGPAAKLHRLLAPLVSAVVVADGLVATVVGVVEAEGSRHARSVYEAAGLAVGAKRPLARLQHRVVVVQPPHSRAEALERRSVLRLRLDDGTEGFSGVLPGAAT